MTRSASACLVVLLATAAAHAGPTEAALVAAMKLPDAPNYSWLTTVDDDARSYEINGKTDRATDLSLVTMPMIGAVRRRIPGGSAATGNDSTALFSGDEKFVVQVDDTWKKPEELAANNGNSRYGGRGGGWGGGMGGIGMGRRGRRGMMGGTGGTGGGGYPSDNGEGSGSGSGRPTLAYSNLQKTLSRPHEEVAIIVAGYSDLKSDGEVVSGTLNETSAKLLLVHAGQKEITPLTASGTFRLWVKDGVLQKYEVKMEGTLALTTGGGRREVTVHQTATTTLKEVGVTTFEAPAEALKKLGVTVNTAPAPAAAPAPASAPTPVAKAPG